MTREDDFSVVVFAKNTSGLYRTYRNIKQNPLADTIQILAVRVEGNADQFSQSDLKELQLLGEKEKTLQAQAMDEKFGPFQMKDTDQSVRILPVNFTVRLPELILHL